MHSLLEDQTENERMRKEYGAEIHASEKESTAFKANVEQAEIRGEKQGVSQTPIGTTGIYRPTRSKRFERMFCIPELECNAEDVIKEICFKDKLVFIPNDIVIGKGIKSSVKDCKIYMQKGGEVYTYNLDNGDKSKPFGVIPQDVIFIVIGEAEKVFIVTGVEGEKKSVYSLPENVVLTVFLETQLYHRLNHFYAYVVKGTSQDDCYATSSPFAGKNMYRIFATTIEFDQERCGLGL